MNGARVFFDTNLLLYLYGGASEKQKQARTLFRQCVEANHIVISTQVAQEVYAAGSGKLGIPRPVLREIVTALLDLPLISIESSHIVSAMQLGDRYQISFWDALILAAAESGGAELLYTEDLNDGQKYGSVLVRNPFKNVQID
jgi:predicted nucleic acid-binding protein